MTTPRQSHRWDLVDVLVEDHHEVEQLFTELEKEPADSTWRGKVVAVVVAALARHSVAEEIYLYPTVRRTLVDGDELADKEIAEHAEAERLMRNLEGLSADDPQFEVLLARLMAKVRDHVAEEESTLFPRLRSVCTPAELAELGRSAENAKKSSRRE